MYEAIDIVTNELYGIDDWLKNCENRKEGLCRVCGEKIYIRADKSENTKTHFSHYRDSKCPTIEKNHRPFAHLNASELDLENGEIIKGKVAEHSFLIFEKCKGMAENLNAKEFRDLIDFATQKEVWNYKGLTFTYVPYILLTCREKFTKGERNYRKSDFYFVFDPNIKNVDELWNQSGKKQKLWKVDCKDNNVTEYSIDSALLPKWYEFTDEYIRNKFT
ncbi:hypothetical protein [Paenibacillus silagei]|uniref:Competence protein CoiA-like family protein n=1 Tax=Paenibacillus silagei TaxID=1670801 RepID=A0ABS4NNQ8_9BACL|nr:hypothetical protein [Paenibacillus silagei]MBP2111693.1 hypothetical protein [Paenibacillus silagei]